MSMISGQCDKLRELAIRANELHEYEMERELDQAADLILELRDGLQQANDENARLRSCLTDDAENARLIMGENARLRELLQRTWDAFHNASSKEFNAVKRDLREQGIEVD